MKAVVLNRYGRSNNISFADIPQPDLKPNEILVQVHAAGLNPIDNMIPKGSFKPIIKLRLPSTLGSDLAGIVVEVGSRVTRFKPGDAVFASSFEMGFGALAEFVVVPENIAALKPANLDFVEAASIPMVGLTAWQALVERGNVQPGQKVFIPAGSGGVGTVAIQLAKHFGAIVGTTTSTSHVDLVRSLGAGEVVDYKKQQFKDVLMNYDFVLGTLRGDMLEKSLPIMQSGGKVVSLVGPPDPAFAKDRGMNVIMKFMFGLLSGRIRRLASKRHLEYSFLFVRSNGEQLAEIGKLLEAGQIRPVIDRVFPFDQANEALVYLEKGHAKGKVVIQVLKE